MSINIDIKLKRASKIYYEGVSRSSCEYYFFHSIFRSEIAIYVAGSGCWSDIVKEQFGRKARWHISHYGRLSELAT